MMRPNTNLPQETPKTSLIRAFFAIDLPQELKTNLATFITKLQKTYKRDSVRFTKPEKLHITLQFLEKINANDVEPLLAAVRQELKQHSNSFRLHFGEMELFPTPYQPRIISIQVGPNKELAHLANLIGKGILNTGY